MEDLWENDEIEILKILYPVMDNWRIANLFKCKIKRIHRKAYRLGLKKNKNLKTTFKKGHMPPTYKGKPNGIITLRKNRNNIYQYIRIGINKWKPLHIYNWEKKFGKIPKGFILTFKNQDRMNCELSNLELITKKDLINKYTIAQYPYELKSTMIKLKELKKIINGKK